MGNSSQKVDQYGNPVDDEKPPVTDDTNKVILSAEGLLDERNINARAIKRKMKFVPDEN